MINSNGSSINAFKNFEKGKNEIIEKNENKEKNKKIVQSIELLIGTLSIDGLKEVQSEIQKLLSDIKK